IKLPPPARPAESMKETLTEGWNFIKLVPAFAYLTRGMLATGSVMTFLLFDVLSDAKFDLGNGFQSFYAIYNLVIAIVSIFIQSFSARIIEAFTLRRSFLIQPFVMLVSVISNFFFPGYMSSAVSQGISR